MGFLRIIISVPCMTYKAKLKNVQEDHQHYEREESVPNRLFQQYPVLS